MDRRRRQSNALSGGSKFILVIFGAGGELSTSRLIPAAINIKKSGFTQDFQILLIDQNTDSLNDFRRDVSEIITGDLVQESPYNSLRSFLENYTDHNIIFFLATPPGIFPNIVQHLAAFIKEDKHFGSKRICIEKPFGNSLREAQYLARILKSSFNEQNIYCIDHFLAKEPVQNILAFRFANEIFSSIWQADCIDHIQISMLEKTGVGNRGFLYEQTGVIKDMMQNHILQVLSLIGMESPASFTPESIELARLKLLCKMQPPNPLLGDKQIILGQYGPGIVDNQTQVGYRSEKDVAKDSTVSTFVALKINIENKRWQGVPIYVRTGKRMAADLSEVVIKFKKAEPSLFHNSRWQNTIVMTLRDESPITLRLGVRGNDNAFHVKPVDIVFNQNRFSGRSKSSAYESLLREVIQGNQTFFPKIGSVLEAWSYTETIMGLDLSNQHLDFPNYACGSWGPSAAANLISDEGRNWQNDSPSLRAEDKLDPLEKLQDITSKDSKAS